MNDDADRAYRALTDVVDVESVAPGMMRVTSWGGSYVVDARDGGCRCPDKEYHEPLRCKHEYAALMADTDLPSPWTPDEQTTDQRIMTDGGQVEAPEGHGQFTVADTENENAFHFDTRSAAEDKLERANEVPGVTADLFEPGESPEFLFHGDDDTPEVVNHAPDADDAPDTDHEPEVLDADTVAEAADQLPDERHVDEDPLKWLPGEFVDTIDGSPAINRKGFEVLSHFYDVSVSADLQTPPEETGHEYCRVKATATIDDREVEAFGSAHVDRGDDAHLLLEMADTRARKRALSIATGAGAVAVDELINEPEGGA